MPKLQITYKPSYVFLLVLLACLLAFNVNTFLADPSLIGVLPIIFQGGLLFLLSTKHIYAQRIIKYWIGFICILLPAIQIILSLFRYWIGNMRIDETAIDLLVSEKIILHIVLVAFGAIILILNKEMTKPK